MSAAWVAGAENGTEADGIEWRAGETGRREGHDAWAFENLMWL